MDNNNFIVSARKYRPTTFTSVVGQKNLTATLRNAIATDRLAHSYLFCGSRGVGKTSCARIFAKTINCSNRTPQGDPCNECDSCRAFNEGRSFNIIEMDAASNNGVDDMRKLTEQVLVPPAQGRYRVFIIDEVHMLSPQAFNAFLKTLEEPPSYVIFVLATTEKHKIIPTILSRCQIYDFNRITVKDIVEHLEMVAEKEGVKAEKKALAVIAEKADGALRDALSIFDQIVASSRGNVTYESTIENLSILDNKYFIRLMDAFANSDVSEALLIFKEIRDKGFNTHFFINGLQKFIRDLMVARDPRTLLLLDATDEEKKELQNLSEKFSPDFYFMALSLINDADMKFREASNKTFLTELLLIKLCQLLSPSPVFRGKEEGHLDTLLPLDTTFSAVTDPIAVNTVSETKTLASGSKPIPATPHSVHIVAEASTPYLPKVKGRPVVGNVISLKEMTSAGNNGNDKADNKEIGPVSPSQSPTIEINGEKLLASWREYRDSVPKKKLLVNVMRNHEPEVMAEKKDTVTIVLENELHRELIEKEKPLLLPYLIKSLGLNVLNLEIQMQEGKINPQMWSEKEILENMIANHPELGKFMSDLDLTLS